MKNIIYAAAAALALTACSEKPLTYTIEGSFDVPQSFQVGDSVITRGPIVGYVYLADLKGNPIDSAQIIDEKFTFNGVIDKGQEPYFAYIIGEYGQGMFVVEPGELTAVLGEPTVVKGTAINDQIVAMMNYVDTIGYQLYDELQSLQEQGGGKTLDQNEIMVVYSKYSGVVNRYVDSIYHANDDNLLGVYCANVMSVQAQSSAELEEIIAPFSDYVKNSQLIQEHLNYLREVEMSADALDQLSADGENNPGN